VTTGLAEQQLQCAAVLLRDVRAAAAGSDDFSLHLDLALADLEFGRALGEPSPAAPRRSLAVAADLLRAARAVPPWLYGGAAQAGWTMVQLARATGVQARGLAPLDEVVGRWIAEYPDTCDVDLPRGLLGLGVYGLAHPEPGVRERFSSGVLDVVEARAEHDCDGMFVRLVANAPRQADGSAGCTVVGVAHGCAGLVSYLASVAGADLSCSARAQSLLAAAVRWLLRQRDPVGGGAPPLWRDSDYAPSRVTWCYGDPGIALALAVAAEVTSSATIHAAAAELASAAVARHPEESGVIDACLCHGAAGLVWFGRRVLDTGATAADRQQAARCIAHWSRYLIEQRHAGPLQFFRGSGTDRNSSFLEGDAGVALALLQAATGTRPAWEQLLLGTPVSTDPWAEARREVGRAPGGCPTP